MTTETRPVLERSRPPVSVLDFDTADLAQRFADRLQDRVEEAWLFGSLAAGTAGPWSDVDLLLVTETAEPFVERPRAFADIREPGIPLDLLVYTPAEYADLPRTNPGFWKAFTAARRPLVTPSNPD
ncbi:MAG: nucleotidyltransferase domain-containing protein [Thiohalospira sp.]